MKLNDQTVSILKNFSTINQNLVIKEGSEIATMSAMKNIQYESSEDQMKQQMAQSKIAIEKKKIMLKKQQLQKQLQLKTQNLKKQVRSGAEQDETR